MPEAQALRIGPSGWSYGDWKGIFYPENLCSKDYLSSYAERFTTTEVSYSFYHLPRPSSYENWARLTPEGFGFAVKASRHITHVRRLRDVGAEWRKFLDNAMALGTKLGPVLLQFPRRCGPTGNCCGSFLDWSGPKL